MSRKKKEARLYRLQTQANGLHTFRVVVEETDLFISAEKNLAHEARELVLEHRGYIQSRIAVDPEFAAGWSPISLAGPVPGIIRDMVSGSKKAGVGPMAAVAGAIAERVGNGLLARTKQVIVENGGDIFIKTDVPAMVGVLAGTSVLSGRIGLKIDSTKRAAAICTSSGTVGHSKSMGHADAVCVLSDSCALADAAATSVGNRVKKKSDIQMALDAGQSINGVSGILIIMGDKVGIWGKIDIVALDGPDGA